jgi:FkbM family methyltransferase
MNLTQGEVTQIISDIVGKGRSSNRPDLSPGKRYLLYGAGGLGRTILGLLKKMGVEVPCFIDKGQFSDNRVEGIEVIRPDSDKILELAAESDGIIVAVYNHRSDLRDIFKTLNVLGCKKIYSPEDLSRAFPKGTLRLDYWLDLHDEPAETGQLITNLARAYFLLGDAPSRELFLELIELRATANHALTLNKIHSPDLSRQYFPDDLPVKIRAERMIDCGAYDGDSVIAAHRYSSPLKRVACFEPDPQNYKKLSTNLSALKLDTEFELFPLAVWSKTTLLSFGSSADTGSALSDDRAESESKHKIVVQAVALDEALRDFRPTLIKMDIEGAEPEALKGAVGMIKESRPQLAICVYHKFKHYWQIPHFIDSLKCGYRLYLRQHGYNGQETVLYALPG